jgi:hypothetical protein
VGGRKKEKDGEGRWGKYRYSVLLDVLVSVDGCRVLVITARHLGNDEEQNEQSEEQQAADGCTHCNESGLPWLEIVVVIALDEDGVSVRVGDLAALSCSDDDVVVLVDLEWLTSDDSGSVGSDLSKMEVNQIRITCQTAGRSAALACWCEGSRISDCLSSNIFRNGCISIGDTAFAAAGEAFPVGLEAGVRALLLTVVSTVEGGSRIDTTARKGGNRDEEERADEEGTEEKGESE